MVIRCGKLDSEKIYYVFTYFGHLMTDQEKLASRHHSSLVKMGDPTEKENKARVRVSLKGGWMTIDPEVLKLLDNGIDDFQKRVVQRILTEHQNQVFLNLCSKCGQLARSPEAKQCRCGHSWRED